MLRYIGIDTGGTLTKVAYFNEQHELQFQAFPSKDLQAVKQWIERRADLEAIGATGGRTEQLREVVGEQHPLHYIVEFEATIKGVRYLLQQEHHSFDRCIVVNVGTGTSIHYMNGAEHTRVGGTGIGGGTLIGLAGLMTGITDYAKIKDKAVQGQRNGIDLLVKDIYEGMDTPIDGNLTASNLGKIAIHHQFDQQPEDLLATVQGLVGEVISTLGIQYAWQYDVEEIVYIGSTLGDNVHLQRVIGDYTKLKKRKPIFLPHSGFAGALGALLSQRGIE